MDYPQALAWLYGTQFTGIKLGLDTIRRLIDALGGQGEARFLHVAGTNGKGSVCAMLDSVCRAAGRRTGLFTSPHLVTFRERLRLDGQPISETAAAAGLTRLRQLTADWNPPPTFFEYTAALALDWFKREGAEVAVWETGLGGRLDATNAITPAVSVLTAIDLDHRDWLGDTLGAIAAEKAGIIKLGVPVVSAPQAEEARIVIEATARDRHAALRWIEQPLAADWRVGLAGSHQRLNAALALAALDAADIAGTHHETARRRGLETVDWPGRFQRLEGSRIILDGAHNPAAARSLAQTWIEEMGGSTRATIVLGILGDKDAAGVCRALAPIAGRFIVVAPRSPRALSVEALQPLLTEAAPEVPCVRAPGAVVALDMARAADGNPILVTGSLFLVGEALSLLTGQPGDPEITAQ
jgi:dihydrofolate synthase/folylpolyglutamate synthase